MTSPEEPAAPPAAVTLPPILPVQPLPVICDKCRAEGIAGDSAFAGIPDILEFEPVPRRPHVNGWTPEYQRAFIAALALTGSPRQAATALGRHAFGAEQLRRARGGRSFSAAWDAALDLAREREFARIHTNLSALAEAAAEAPPPLSRGEGNDDQDSAAHEIEETRERIRQRLMRMRRRYVDEIRDDPDKRAAWEVLHGAEDFAGGTGSENRGRDDADQKSLSPDGTEARGDPGGSGNTAGEGEGDQ